jgi:hypothetical protein
MKVTSQKQITKKLLQENDEVVTYTAKKSGITSVAKLRVIDGEARYITDHFNGRTVLSKTHKSLAEMKRGMIINHF